VTIELANPDQVLRAGQYALARVDLPDDRPRLTLPIPAIASAGGQDQLWIIDNGALSRRVVTLGRRDEAAGRVEVLSGLAPGAQVLAVRFDNLREGAKAVVVADKAAPLAATTSGASAPAR
jgi:hypothetical protein